MDKYLDIFINGYKGYASYLWSELTLNYDYKPIWENYFYWVIGVSVIFFFLEISKPWRKHQPIFRKDFWLDFFYMYFNFFLFSLLIYNAASEVAVNLFNDFLAVFGISNLVAFEIASWPIVFQLLLMFVVADFIQWNIHRLLHRVPFLWQFHKVHHSVEQMGFAAQLRFHWMETIVYKSIQYIPLAMIGFGIDDFFIVYITGFIVGHFNHANFNINIGPLKYALNNPQMHIWHHAKHLPEDRKYGVNFGLTLSIWDYIFGSAYIPESGRDIPLGFQDDDYFPSTFLKQFAYGFGLTKIEKLQKKSIRLQQEDPAHAKK